MASPPSYAPSLLPPPVYTLFPQSHEETLCKSTALAGPTELRDAQITVGEAFGSVTFTSQARGTIMPSYGRGSSVEGIVRLRHVHRVCAVKLKARCLSAAVSPPTDTSIFYEQLAGNVRLTSPEGGEDTLPFFERDYLLWTATDPSTQAPATHSFFIPLPADIDDDGALRPLPPSFSAAFDDLTVNVEYRCTVTIHQNRTFLGLVSALKYAVSWTPASQLSSRSPAQDIHALLLQASQSPATAINRRRAHIHLDSQSSTRRLGCCGVSRRCSGPRGSTRLRGAPLPCSQPAAAQCL